MLESKIVSDDMLGNHWLGISEQRTTASFSLSCPAPPSFLSSYHLNLACLVIQNWLHHLHWQSPKQLQFLDSNRDLMPPDNPEIASWNNKANLWIAGGPELSQHEGRTKRGVGTRMSTYLTAPAHSQQVRDWRNMSELAKSKLVNSNLFHLLHKTEMHS